MKCANCSCLVSPGLEIQVQVRAGSTVHCPYCLHLLPGRPADRETANADVSVRKFEFRRQVRQRFMDRLKAQAGDGAPHCPVCSSALTVNDEITLRSSEHFSCRSCSHDLAAVAYEQEAYDPGRWGEVTRALPRWGVMERCADCCCVGAIARACQLALSKIPEDLPEEQRLVAAALDLMRWNEPDPDCNGDCPPVAHYREQVGTRLLVL